MLTLSQNTLRVSSLALTTVVRAFVRKVCSGNVFTDALRQRITEAPFSHGITRNHEGLQPPSVVRSVCACVLNVDTIKWHGYIRRNSHAGRCAVETCGTWQAEMRPALHVLGVGDAPAASADPPSKFSAEAFPDQACLLRQSTRRRSPGIRRPAAGRCRRPPLGRQRRRSLRCRRGCLRGLRGRQA